MKERISKETSMKKLICTLSSILFATSLAASGIPKMAPGPKLTPEEKAIERFNSGSTHLDRAAKLQKDAEAAPAERQEKLHQKALAEFEKASKDFTKAIELNPQMYQAHTQLGFALRKLGNYPEALASYDRALAIFPNLSPALEYRAEAYLGLDRLEEAKHTYVLLFSGDRPRADELAAAMKNWVEQRRAAPGTVAAETIDAFEKWLSERRQVASQTSDLLTPKRSW
jgi:tetratricopeptide (TPR) repeat protein